MQPNINEHFCWSSEVEADFGQTWACCHRNSLCSFQSISYCLHCWDGRKKKGMACCLLIFPTGFCVCLKLSSRQNSQRSWTCRNHKAEIIADYNMLHYSQGQRLLKLSATFSLVVILCPWKLCWGISWDFWIDVATLRSPAIYYRFKDTHTTDVSSLKQKQQKPVTMRHRSKLLVISPECLAGCNPARSSLWKASWLILWTMANICLVMLATVLWPYKQTGTRSPALRQPAGSQTQACLNISHPSPWTQGVPTTSLGCEFSAQPLPQKALP